jgi:transcriptional regulator with XRE-family HTH domain
MNDSQGLIDRRKLRAERIRARLTGPALAKRAGLSKATISAIERGERNCLPGTLGLIADALGLDMTALMPDEPDGEAAA